MSLINDALKRATKTQPAAGQPAAPANPMRPAETHQSTGALPRYFFPLLLCIFCGAFWFVVRGWETQRQQRTGIYPEPITVQARESASAAAESVNGSIGQPDSAPPTPETNPIPSGRNFSLNGESGASSPSSVSFNGAAGTTPAPAATVAASPAEPVFRLQGIIYRPASPSAVVNAKTVFIGDLVSGARVKAIDRQSVTLIRDGQTQVLFLP